MVQENEKAVRAVRNLAAFYQSQEQLQNKGNLLIHSKSGRFLKTYIDVYERAIIGFAEIRSSKKPVDIKYGFACIEEAIVEKGILYLSMVDERVYRIRYLKDAETIEYMINRQKSEVGKDERS